VKNTVKNTFLLTAAVAALVAGTSLASAQSERREMPAAAAPEQKAPGGKADQQKGNAPQKSESVKPAPTAQVPDKAAPTAQVPDKAAPDKAKPAPTAQAPDKSNSPKTQTDGQGGAPSPSAKPNNAQAPSHDAAPSAAAQGSKPGASTPLSNEQHVKIRETLRGEKAEHLKNVAFAITIGEAVPRTVHLYKLPVRTLEYVPQYRDYEYILVGDEILIVDPRTFRIVAVIPA
jgi:outer membrane biosynthesis protein TonB